LRNVFQTQTALWLQVANETDLDGGEEDLVSGKVYLRRELWPAQYGLADVNDHVTLYMVRNQSLNDSTEFVTGREDTRNTNYHKEESIVGTALHLDRSGPYPDPTNGYQLNALLENAGHFLGATQFFYRSALDGACYHPVTARTSLAMRLKYGWGYPDDKDLFHIGGMDGLRGFDRKTVRGSSALLGSLEYRFPLLEKLRLSILDNILGLDAVGGVVFFDGGAAWFDDMDGTKARKDAGFGLRFKVTIGSFLEKIVLRLDVARPINEEDDDTQVWFGINHAF
jgi:outer membrane protein insertion porin family